jgi:putative holliday junction resolvase
MTKEAEEKQIIETIDENGEVVNFELFDIVEVEEKEYALLLPADSEEDNDEVILMRLTKEGEDYLFEAIEDDEEFDRVSEYIENLADMDEEE